MRMLIEQKAVTKSGKERYDIVFPKYKMGGYIVRKVVQNPTYGGTQVHTIIMIIIVCTFIGYIDKLVKETLSLCSDKDDTSFSTGSLVIPTSLNSNFVKREKSMAIAQNLNSLFLFILRVLSVSLVALSCLIVCFQLISHLSDYVFIKLVSSRNLPVINSFSCLYFVEWVCA